MNLARNFTRNTIFQVIFNSIFQVMVVLQTFILSAAHHQVHNQNDVEQYWRKRPNCEGLSAVLWNNELYNGCVDKLQKELLMNILGERDNIKTVLDLGCGIGRLSKFLAQQGYSVTAVDFEEMIRKAKQLNPHQNVEYLEIRMQDFKSMTHYDCVLCSAVLYTIHSWNELTKIINKTVRHLGCGYYILMEPFHTDPLLRRQPCFSIGEITKFFESLGLKVVKKSGILFWPFRMVLANSKIDSQRDMASLFEAGESIMRHFSPMLLSDYKVLILAKSCSG